MGPTEGSGSLETYPGETCLVPSPLPVSLFTCCGPWDELCNVQPGLKLASSGGTGWVLRPLCWFTDLSAPLGCFYSGTCHSDKKLVHISFSESPEK